MKFECPSCQMQLQAEPEFAGKYVRCPGCNTKLQIPETVSSQTSLQGIPKPKVPSPSLGLTAPDAGEEETGAQEQAAEGGYDREQFERGGWEEKDPTNPNGFVCFGIGMALTVLLAAILFPFNPPKEVEHSDYNGMQFISSLFFKHWEVSFANFLLFAWAMAILFFKSQMLRRQRQALLLNVLPWELGAEINADNVGSFIDHLYKLPHALRDSMMVNRIRKALELFEVKQNNDSVAHMLESQSDIDSMRIGGSYTLIKAFFWAIPILGFIGTVIGLSHAIGGMDLSNMEDIEAVKNSLGAVTGGLGTAFDATLLGLLLAMILNFPLNTMSKDEDDCLNEIDAFCNEVLLPRLNDGGGLAGGDPAGMMNMLVNALTQVQREFLGELTAVTGQIKQQSIQMEARAAAHEKRVAEEFVDTMKSLRSELLSAVSESARSANEYTRSISQGLADHAGKLEQKASSEFGTIMSKMREDLTGPLSESAKSTSDYVKALTSAVEGLNKVLADLGEKQVVIQQVKKKGWFGR